MPEYIAKIDGEEIQLKLNGEDNPSCPVCDHYNAMLPNGDMWEEDEEDEDGAELLGYYLKCRDCKTQVEMHEVKEPEGDREVDDYDGFITDVARGGYSVSLNQQFVGRYSDFDEAFNALRERMDAEKYWPQCWQINERGTPLMIRFPDSTER